MPVSNLCTLSPLAVPLLQGFKLCMSRVLWHKLEGRTEDIQLCLEVSGFSQGRHPPTHLPTHHGGRHRQHRAGREEHMREVAPHPGRVMPHAV